MPEKLQLDDGGPLYHPDRPLGFHPSLRAAAYLLVAGERVVGGILHAFRDHTFSSSVHRPRRCQVVRWARRHHLASPYLLELLFLTLSTWHNAHRTRWLARHDLAGMVGAMLSSASRHRLQHLEERCTGVLEGWGPWVEILTCSPEQTTLDPLFELAAPLAHLSLPRPAPPPTRCDLSSWNPEIESWEECEVRLRQQFDRALTRHRRDVEGRLLAGGLRRVPVKTAERHFEWLALRQLRGVRPGRLAQQYTVSPSTVHEALSSLSRLLELPLRPVKPGPEEW